MWTHRASASAAAQEGLFLLVLAILVVGALASVAVGLLIVRTLVKPLQLSTHAVKVIMGDLGTFDGIQTSVVGEVLRRDGSAIAGLYAVGNDRASIMGGNYPGAGITHGPNMTFGYLTAHHIADLAGAKA